MPSLLLLVVVVLVQLCHAHARRTPAHLRQINHQLRARYAACDLKRTDCNLPPAYDPHNCFNICLSPACYAAIYAHQPVGCTPFTRFHS